MIKPFSEEVVVNRKFSKELIICVLQSAMLMRQPGLGLAGREDTQGRRTRGPSSLSWVLLRKGHSRKLDVVLHL